MAVNQNCKIKIKIITYDNVEFTINLFSPELGLSNFLKPILFSFIDGNVSDLSWQDIISNYNDYDLDLEKIKEPIVLTGISSQVFKYLLDFCKKLQDFKDKNPNNKLSTFTYNILKDDLNKTDIKHSIQILQGIFYLDLQIGLSKARETWLINLIANKILDQFNYQEGDNKYMKIIKNYYCQDGEKSKIDEKLFELIHPKVKKIMENILLRLIE